jgi:sterol desaturase/sphingolipid hydroxylase (fatty acid hydroxylase superfamily)
MMLLAGFFVFGCFAWTLVEYVMHMSFHLARGKNHASREHLHHHAHPDYFSPALQKAAVALTIVATAVALGSLVISFKVGVAFSAGLGSGYLVYEWLHRRAHVAAPLNRYGASIRARHFHHHFVAPNNNHGVTTSLWDRVFGTYIEPEQVPVPRKHAHALAWVLSSDGASIDDRFRTSYRLV